MNFDLIASNFIDNISARLISHFPEIAVVLAGLIGLGIAWSIAQRKLGKKL